MGKSIAVVEADRVGGSCVNYGCTPTKTLVASARVAHMAHRGEEFGIRLTGQETNFPRVHERVNAMRDPATKGFQQWLEQATDFYPGWASFVDDHTVAIGETSIYGEQILIHTGTRARVPNFPGIDTVPWLDNKGVLDLEEVPEHLVVIGGSYIGLEFAQAFRRLGSRVTVLQRAGRLITREDPDVSEIARDVLSGEGVEVLVNTDIQALERSGSGSGVRVKYAQQGKGGVVEGSHLLIGIGRVPNSDMLNLPAAGVDTDKRGFIPVDDYGRTSVPHIFALGDVNGRGAFTHTSVHDGQVYMDLLKGAASARKISDRTPIHSMFIDPPLARVGMSEAEARESGKNVLVATRPMSRINRAREKDETDGIVKVFVDADTKHILGATIFGVGGDEIIGMLALAMQAGLPYTMLQDT
ncbi:MAG: mercuric reductase, partial [Spirochaetia bacterium]